MPDYKTERLDSWARQLFAELRPDLYRLHGWDQFRNTPVGQKYVAMAEVAIKIHLKCCEQRCKKCGDKFVHHCLHCDRG